MNIVKNKATVKGSNIMCFGYSPVVYAIIALTKWVISHQGNLIDREPTFLSALTVKRGLLCNFGHCL
jgi:hypothetical protein